MYRFRVVLYYIKKKFIKLTLIIKLNVKLIIFLNKNIFIIELRYWLIEFKIINII